MTPEEAELVDRVINDILRQEIDDESLLGGSYALGGGNYIGKWAATIEHAERALAAARDPDVRQRIASEIEQLRPYWTAGATKEQAVAAMLDDRFPLAD